MAGSFAIVFSTSEEWTLVL